MSENVFWVVARLAQRLKSTFIEKNNFFSSPGGPPFETICQKNIHIIQIILYFVEIYFQNWYSQPSKEGGSSKETGNESHFLLYKRNAP